MNRKEFIILSCIAAGILSAGCGSEVDQSTPSLPSAASSAVTSSAETTAETPVQSEAQAETNAQTGEAQAETAAPEAETEAAQETAENDENAPTEAQAKELINAVNTLEKLGGCGATFDEEKSHTSDNGTVYYRVTQSGFSGTADIAAFEGKYFTQSMINERYSNIISGDTPIFIDAEGELYMQNSARGFYILNSNAPKIEKSSENGYSILVEFDDFGGMSTADIRVANENGSWKVNGISFGS